MNISPPKSRNFVAYQGITFSRSLKVFQSDLETPLDLSDYDITGKMRPDYGSQIFVNIDISSSDPVNGDIRITIDKDTMKKVPVTQYEYSIVITKKYNSSSSSPSYEVDDFIVYRGTIDVKGTAV